jgi:hypothetical protein
MHIGQGTSNIHALRLIQAERARHPGLPAPLSGVPEKRTGDAANPSARSARPASGRSASAAQRPPGRPFNGKLTKSAIQVCRSERHGLALGGREL